MTRALLLLLAGTFAIAPSARAGDWLQWGGPAGNFTVDSVTLADRWPDDGPPLLWKRPLGDGFSSILFDDGRLYTMYRADEEEVIVCLDAASGETIWEQRYPRTLWPNHDTYRQSFTKGPNATPLIVGNRLFAIGVAGELRCLDKQSGSLLWKLDLPRTFGRRTRQEEYGFSASPLPYEGFIIVQVGGTDHAVVALKPEDGSVIWKSPKGTVSYAQATVARLAKRDQFVYFSADGVESLDPKTGQRLWSFHVPTLSGNHLTPVVRADDTHLYVSSQGAPGGGRLLKLSDDGDRTVAKQEWFDGTLRGSCWTLIRVGDYIYGSSGDQVVSLLTAFDWHTGKIAWRERGFHMAQSLYADEKLIFLDKTGRLGLARVSPEKFELLDSHQLTGSGSLTLPTLVDGKLYVRDRKQILAVDLAKPR
jgi:outer membrane protein assembly factor BamB